MKAEKNDKMPKTKVDELRERLQKKREVENIVQAAAKPEGEKAPNGDLGDQIRAVEEEAKEHYDKLLRVMAEFENYKKRMAKEREDLTRYSNEKLLLELLPSLDDMDRVLDHVAPDAADDVKKIAEGVELVRKAILATLEKFGLKEVAAEGQMFDPAMHEAIAAVESEGREAGSIIAVHRRGYWLGDRLLRPAMVTVVKGD